MSRRSRLEREPWSNDLLATMRDFERGDPERPRIGRSRTVDDDVVLIGQDPFLEFPSSNVVTLDQDPRGRPRLTARFMGFFGPQGALPLSGTLESRQWARRGDVSYRRFLEMFLTRFVHLFFRAWGAGRPAVQRDRPRDDRFAAYVGGFSGIDAPDLPEADLSAVYSRLGFSGLLAPRVKSAGRLARFLRASLRADVDIEEHVGMWLDFAREDRTCLGTANASLGTDAVLGGRTWSINDRIAIVLRTRGWEDYCSLLPTGAKFNRMNEAIFFYLGHRWDYRIQLVLPAAEARRISLGREGRLGWTSWISPKPGPDGLLRDARFAPPPARPTNCVSGGMLP